MHMEDYPIILKKAKNTPSTNSGHLDWKCDGKEDMVSK